MQLKQYLCLPCIIYYVAWLRFFGIEFFVGAWWRIGWDVPYHGQLPLTPSFLLLLSKSEFLLKTNVQHFRQTLHQPFIIMQTPNRPCSSYIATKIYKWKWQKNPGFMWKCQRRMDLKSLAKTDWRSVAHFSFMLERQANSMIYGPKLFLFVRAFLCARLDIARYNMVLILHCTEWIVYCSYKHAFYWAIIKLPNKKVLHWIRIKNFLIVQAKLGGNLLRHLLSTISLKNLISPFMRGLKRAYDFMGW